MIPGGILFVGTGAVRELALGMPGIAADPAAGDNCFLGIWTDDSRIETRRLVMIEASVELRRELRPAAIRLICRAGSPHPVFPF
jgi:hypothetical protein